MTEIGMGTLRRFLIRLAGLFRKGRQEQEMAEEFESHFQMHVDENLRRGMGAAEACARIQSASEIRPCKAIRLTDLDLKRLGSPLISAEPVGCLSPPQAAEPREWNPAGAR